jgi:Zn-dependent protease
MDEPLNPISSAAEETTPLPAKEQVIYPPKYQKKENKANIWIRSIVSLAAYLVLGYYVFPSYKILLLITLIVLIHELGHFIAMKVFRYKDLGMFFIPLLGAYVSGTKREVSQKESAIILLAGPLPGIIMGIIFFLLMQQNPQGEIAGISYYYIYLFFVILNLFNLLPVYPLDGGQLLNRVFLNENDFISRVFIFLSIGLLCWFAWKSHTPVLFIFPVMMLIRQFGEKKLTVIEKRMEEAGINTDIEYADLPDKDYWAIRNIVLEEMTMFKDVPPAPPFEYSHKEDRIMNVIQSLLHRHLLQDVSVAGKIFILLIWIAAIFSPWLLGMNMSFFSRFGL